jgi:hypothetical protein
MSQHDPATNPDPRFATDLDVADAASSPARSGDSLVVHGMLSMIAPDEPSRLESRIGRAIAAVRAEAAQHAPLAAIGPRSAGLTAGVASARGRHSPWQRRFALAGGGLGIAAVLGFAVLFAPSGQSTSGSQAYAALDSIRAATARTEDRTFRVRIEHTGQREMGQREMGRPGGPPRDGPRDGARARDGMRDGTRDGELVLGSGGRYTLTWRGGGRGATVTTGFSGSEYWAVLPDGTVRTAEHPSKLRLPPLFGTEPARPGEDDDAEQLTLDSMLARLERGYEISFADRAPAVGQGGAPMIEVTATRRAGAGRRDRDRMPPPQGPRPGSERPGPSGGGLGGGGGPGGPGTPADTIMVLADASTFDVERLEARWTSGMQRTLVIERIPTPDAPASRPAEWFTPAAHTRTSPR